MSDDLPTVTLRVPVKQGPQTYQVLTFQEPDGGALAACGYPFQFTTGGNGEKIQVINANAITQLISRLGGIPLSAARMIKARDWNDCLAVILGFFGDAAPETNAPDTPPS